jgi:hypothetical protein
VVSACGPVLLFPLPFLDRFIGFNFPEDLTFVRYFDVGVLNSYFKSILPSNGIGHGTGSRHCIEEKRTRDGAG